MAKQHAVICDLDGTLALNTQGRSMFDYASARHDAVNGAVAVAIKTLYFAGYQIIFLSGREMEPFGYDATIEWINHHFPWVAKDPIYLLMRKKNDYRKDSIVKKEIYHEFIEPHFDVIITYDDRDQVVDMWRDELNLTCFQVARGAF